MSIPMQSSRNSFAESDPYGFGAHLFNDWRFLDEKGQQPNPDFVLNFPQYQGASILLAREKLRLRFLA